jgi:ABC-type Fe3+/spermidine/putrescine transport system ATPase subunit
MIALDHLSKQFGAELAVRNVSLAVEQGEFVTLLGPSGCGKTTTLRCIAGLERPDDGEIRIGGDVVAAPARRIYLYPEQRNIGMVRLCAASGAGACAGQSVILSLRPENIEIAFEAGDGEFHPNCIEGEVVDTIYLGNAMECRVKVGCHELGIQIDQYEQIAPPQKVYLSFAPNHALALAG